MKKAYDRKQPVPYEQSIPVASAVMKRADKPRQTGKHRQQLVHPGEKANEPSSVKASDGSVGVG